MNAPDNARYFWKWILHQVLMSIFEICNRSANTENHKFRNLKNFKNDILGHMKPLSKSNINVQWMRIGQPISDWHFHCLSH